MDILRLRPITSHVRVKLSCDNYRQGKFGKFIKSKFKILTCVVLLGRLNTMRGISAGKYDKGNMSIMKRRIWVGEIYIAINYISIVPASHSPVTIKTTTNFSDIWYLLLKSVLIRFLYFNCFMGGFNMRCSYEQAVFFKVYATHFLMWPPLWYNSKLAKSIPLFLNPSPFIQKSPFKYFIML